MQSSGATLLKLTAMIAVACVVQEHVASIVHRTARSRYRLMSIHSALVQVVVRFYSSEIESCCMYSPAVLDKFRYLRRIVSDIEGILVFQGLERASCILESRRSA